MSLISSSSSLAKSMLACCSPAASMNIAAFCVPVSPSRLVSSATAGLLGLVQPGADYRDGFLGRLLDHLTGAPDQITTDAPLDRLHDDPLVAPARRRERGRGPGGQRARLL